jgi:lantibiotic transport system ATP-binding protein
MRQVGALVEAPAIYPHLTARENLTVIDRLCGDSADIAGTLDLVGLREAADRLAGTFSLGMKQRLGLGFALLRQPSLLILDEPTNGLDPAGISEIRELIRRLPREREMTIFLSSHLLSEVEQVASHIGIIQGGRLRFQGTIDELHAKTETSLALGVGQPTTAAELLGSQGLVVSGGQDGRLHVRIPDLDRAAAINSALVRHGVRVHHLALERPDLEEIFFTITSERTDPPSAN